jgi:hypothetical protein
METHLGLTRERSDTIARDIIPIGRQPRPDEVAWACAFLAAERSAARNGTVMHVDGSPGGPAVRRGQPGDPHRPARNVRPGG